MELFKTRGAAFATLMGLAAIFSIVGVALGLCSNPSMGLGIATLVLAVVACIIGIADHTGRLGGHVRIVCIVFAVVVFALACATWATQLTMCDGLNTGAIMFIVAFCLAVLAWIVALGMYHGRK